MRRTLTTRSLVALLALSASAAGASTSLRAQNSHVGYALARGQGDQRSAPIERSHVQGLQRRENPAGPRGEHLAEWMSQHRNLSPAQQQQALDREPGFRDLPQATQQRYHDRLAQLNAMPPQQRQRLLAHNEAMERLSPPQREEVRSAMQQLGSLPLDQRRVVARTFRQLRDLPPEQRWSTVNSDRFRGQFNDAQRSTLGNLLRIEPMLPPPEYTPR